MNITGATGASYTIAAVALTDAGTYDAVATNSQGNATSTGAVLTVKVASGGARSPFAAASCAFTLKVCGEEAAPFSDENLCWVCRRLKISAWREDGQQMPAQE